MIEVGATLTLEIEKAAAGGRMLARHLGQVVLVLGAIPGERVSARVERTGKGLAYAEAVDILSASADRRPAGADWRCGGNVFAHVAYTRQLQIKGEIIQDAFGRIGRVPLVSRPDVIGSPEQGYRMRARLHASGAQLGFLREGTHQLCDATATGQLLPATSAWIGEAQEVLGRERMTGLAGMEIAENLSGDLRACHLDLEPGADPESFAPLGEGLAGLSAQRADRSDVVQLSGAPYIADDVQVLEDDPASVRLRRSVRAFFQGNRFLLETLVRHVVSLVPPGPVVDLYAGVGLFGLSLAAAGVVQGSDLVTLVEGDAVSAADLLANAAVFGDRVRVERRSVEGFLGVSGSPGRAAALRSGAAAAGAAGTFVVDPPRTGLSKEALAGIVRRSPSRVVYVSCDVATLARDTRALLDGGYDLSGITGFDLFPNTAHVESVAVFVR